MAGPRTREELKVRRRRHASVAERLSDHAALWRARLVPPGGRSREHYARSHGAGQTHVGDQRRFEYHRRHSGQGHMRQRDS